MAKLKDILRLQGKAGAFSFTHGSDGFTARKSEGMNGDRIATGKNFDRTRENGAEFGRAGKSGKLLRDALSDLTAGVSDRYLTSRLTTAMLKMVKSDPTSDRGMRTAALGDPTLLKGFEFNATSPLKTVFKSGYETELDKAAGTAKVMLPAFNPKRMMSVPEGATHYMLLAGVIAADFDGEASRQVLLVSDFKEVINNNVAPEELSLTLPEPSPDFPMFVVFGIEFVQMVNGKPYPIKNSGFNSLQLVTAA